MNPRTTRTGDPDGITIDRKIPLWGVLGVVGGLIVQGVLVWNGQSIQAAEMRHQSEQIQDLVTQVKAMTAQLAAKDGIDIEQNLRIGELNRRVTAIETARGTKP